MSKRMASRRNAVRRSIALSAEVDKKVAAIARKRRLSNNRVLVELIEAGLASAAEKEQSFFELAERFRSATDPKEVAALGEELGRFVFGE